MLLADIVETSRRVTEASGRRTKVDLLGALLRTLDPEEVEIVVAFLSGYARQGRIGVGWATLRGAAAPAAAIASIEIHEVDRALASLAAVEGRGSDRRKRELLQALLARATPAEQTFLTGLLLGEIRQGALEGVMMEALAKASGVDSERIRRAVMMAGDIARVARSALESGTAALGQYDVQLFRPVQPMLAQTAEDVEAALDDLGEAAFEFKFDGQRVQVHRSGDDVRIFSRSLHDLTAAVPEIVESVRQLPGRDLILDGEVLSLAADGRPRPFQVTARRFGRKLDLERVRAELPLTPLWFDLLYLDGQSLMDEAQSRRFSTLEGLVPPEALVPHLVTGNPEQAGEFLRMALTRGHEGIMAKAGQSAYAAGARGQSWLKIKKRTRWIWQSWLLNGDTAGARAG